MAASAAVVEATIVAVRPCRGLVSGGGGEVGTSGVMTDEPILVAHRLGSNSWCCLHAGVGILIKVGSE